MLLTNFAKVGPVEALRERSILQKNTTNTKVKNNKYSDLSKAVNYHLKLLNVYLLN
jgi:hypothetical protein